MFGYIIIAIILSVAYFFSEKFFDHLKKIETKLVSFSSGLFITSIFLLMLPVLIQDTGITKVNNFFIALWGFVILHIFEKYIRQYSKNKQKNMLKLKMFDQLLNHLMLGYAITYFFMAKTSIFGYIIIIPLAVYLFSSAVISEEAHKKFHSTALGKLICSLSIFIGALLAIILSSYGMLSNYLFSFGVGVFIYMIVKDIMPGERKGDVFYFLYGIITYFLILGAVELVMTLA